MVPFCEKYDENLKWKRHFKKMPFVYLGFLLPWATMGQACQLPPYPGFLLCSKPSNILRPDAFCCHGTLHPYCVSLALRGQDRIGCWIRRWLHRQMETQCLPPGSVYIGIDLENIVYYKDDTHYFVMTAKKQCLLRLGVLRQVGATGREGLGGGPWEVQAGPGQVHLWWVWKDPILSCLSRHELPSA